MIGPRHGNEYLPAPVLAARSQEPIMIVTADEVNRSFKGTLDLLHLRAEGLSAFDISEQGFWRSFTAIWLTLPAYVVSVAFERVRLGHPGGEILDSLWLDAVVALGHIAGFVALPVAMIWIARRLHLTDRYVPFVIVTNWISAIGLMILSIPAILLLAGWATPSLASLFTLAFAFLVLRVQWFATKVTLGVSSGWAVGIVGLGILLNFLIGSAMRVLIG
jgi:hypothetical protein